MNRRTWKSKEGLKRNDCVSNRRRKPRNRNRRRKLRNNNNRSKLRKLLKQLKLKKSPWSSPHRKLKVSICCFEIHLFYFLCRYHCPENLSDNFQNSFICYYQLPVQYCTVIICLTGYLNTQLETYVLNVDLLMPIHLQVI